MRRKITLWCMAMAITLISKAQWEPINPGAGGQIQDIICDPNIKDRLILASDMEGIYESTNNGESWHVKGELHQNRVYAVAIPKSTGNSKMYVGHVFGVDVSNDGGTTFSLANETRKKSIGAIAVHPSNTNVVLAGIGWRDDYEVQFYGAFGLQKNGHVTLFRSTDGGNSWTEKTMGGSVADRNIHSITFDQSNGNNVYVGSAGGVYKSTDGGNNWTFVNPPGNTHKNRGVVLSPDGNILYAVYLTTAGINYSVENGQDLEAKVYAKRVWDTGWQEIGGSMPDHSYWLPDVDPRSTGSTHKVLLSMDQERQGLWEGTITWNSSYNSASPGSTQWSQAWSDNDVTDGWDVGKPNCRFAHYTPDGNGWSGAIWSTQNQTIYRGDDNGSGYTWHNRYSYTNNTDVVYYYGIPVPSYGGRGTESTYTWDIDAHDNYVIQGMGDNGPMESWDGGQTWSNIWMRMNAYLSDVQAVEIAEFTEETSPGVYETTPIVMAQMTQGFGGNAFTGNLYTKKLSTHSTADTWEFYAGGANFRGGLPNGLFSDIAVSPVDKGQVYVYSRLNGLYTQNLFWAYNEHQEGREPYFNKISNGVADQIYSVKKIAPHPTNQNIVFLSSVGGSATQQGVYKGVRTGNDPNNENANWTWTKIYQGSGWDAEVDAWEYNGQVYLFYSGQSAVDGDGDNFVGAISLDEGATWKTVLKSANTKALVSHSWYNEVTTGGNPYNYKFQNKGGLVGYDDKVIMCHYDHTLQKTYAVLQGTISGNSTSNASVNWQDFTGDLHFGGLTTAKVIQEGADRKLYVSTAGAGAWRRTLGGSGTPSNQAPTVSISSPSNGATFTEGDNITINANASDTDGTISKVEFYSNGSLLGEDTSSPYSFTINNASVGTFSLTAKATDDDGAQTTSSAVSVTVNSSGGSGCSNPSLNSNGELDGGTSSWNFYTNSGAGANASWAVVSGAGLSGSNAAKITISNGGSGDSDIQFYTNFGTLESGKTYEILYKAKSSSNRNMRVQLLEEGGSWTNYVQETVALTGSVTDYSMEVTMSTTDNNARLDFFLGANAADVWIDAVIVREKCSSSPANQAPAVSITSPSNGATFTEGDNITINANASDSDGTISKVEFYSNGSLLGEDTSSPYSFTINNASVGTFSLTAKATDDDGAQTTSSAVSVTVNSSGGSGCSNPSLNSNGELDGGTSSWNFYTNSGAGANASWAVVSGAGLSGSNAAKITISNGGSGDSDIQFYTNFGTLESGKTYEILYKAKSSSNRNMRVQLLEEGGSWTNYVQETVALTGSVTDYSMEVTMSTTDNNARLDFFLGANAADVWIDAVIVREKCSSSPANQAPTVSISSPSNGATFTEGDNITINANASDSDGTISKVELYSNGSLLGEDTSSPYSFTINNASVGTFSLTARATDDDGAQTTSSAVSVTVNSSGGSGSGTYRYLKLTGYGTVANDVTIQQIHWMSGGNSYPDPKLTWSTKSKATSSTNGANDYAAFDNTNVGWVVANNFPAWIVIDLGAGNEINPDEIQIKANASDRGFSSFDCHGSNDNNSWTLLHSESGLTSGDYPGSWGTFNFGSGARMAFQEATIPSELSDLPEIYPNPTTRHQGLNIVTRSADMVSINIYDLNGQLLLHRSLETHEEGRVKIGLHAIDKPGLYMIRLLLGAQQTTRKIWVK